MIFKKGDNVFFLNSNGEKLKGVVTNIFEADHAVGISSDLRYYRCDADDVVLAYEEQNEFLNTNRAEPNYHDSHYMKMDIQPVDIYETFPVWQRVGIYRASAIKYLVRLGSKDNALQEAEKAHRFTGWLVQVLKGEKVNPRE